MVGFNGQVVMDVKKTIQSKIPEVSNLSDWADGEYQRQKTKEKI